MSSVVTHEACDLGENDSFSREDFSPVCFVSQRNETNSEGKWSPRTKSCFSILEGWRDCNTGQSHQTSVSPVSFNKVTKAVLVLHASSAYFEGLFSDFGRHEGRTRQSTLSSSLQMTSVIRSNTMLQIHTCSSKQNDIIHPKAVVFKRICDAIAE